MQWNLIKIGLPRRVEATLAILNLDRGMTYRNQAETMPYVRSSDRSKRITAKLRQIACSVKIASVPLSDKFWRDEGCFATKPRIVQRIASFVLQPTLKMVSLRLQHVYGPRRRLGRDDSVARRHRVQIQEGREGTGGTGNDGQLGKGQMG